MSRKVSSTHDDLEQENKRARVLSLHSRGLTQSEIAQHVNVTQQKVSADLKYIREVSRKVIENAARNASFVYANYFAVMNQIKKELWEIAGSNANNANPDPHFNSLIRDRIAALAMLKECYKNSLEACVGDRISEMSAIRPVQNMKGEDSFKTMTQNDLTLKDFAKIQQEFVH